MYLSINKFLPYTKVEGPGLRACIWVQGCPIKCKNCSVPETWGNHGEEISVNKLAKLILKLDNIEGVTFSGGEPFFQSKPLVEFGRIIKNKSKLSIVTFTGYTIEQIMDSDNQDWDDLLSLTDILIDGPFKEELKSNKFPWSGSSNQRYHFLTDRYKYLELSLSKIPRKIEILVHPDGKVSVNGVISQQDLKHIQKGFLIK